MLNNQLHVISDLFTRICLSIRTLSYGKAMLWYYDTPCEIWLGNISYSEDTFAILYLVSGFAGDPGDPGDNSIIIIECDFVTKSVSKP